MDPRGGVVEDVLLEVTAVLHPADGVVEIVEVDVLHATKGQLVLVRVFLHSLLCLKAKVLKNGKVTR